MTDPREYDYNHEGQREKDNRHAWKARDLLEAGICDEAMREAGKIEHHERHDDLVDEISHNQKNA